MLDDLKIILDNIKPGDLYLPAKFETFEKKQVEVLQQLVPEKKKYRLLEAPCGFGKSVVAAASGRVRGMIMENKAAGQRMIITCIQKSLQQQFVDDFSHDSTGKEYAV
jgi:Rad3-related DNA helicase